MTFDDDPYPEPLDCLHRLLNHGYIITLRKDGEGRYKMDMTGPGTDHGIANSPELCLQLLWSGSRKYLSPPA